MACSCEDEDVPAANLSNVIVSERLVTGGILRATEVDEVDVDDDDDDNDEEGICGGWEEGNGVACGS